MSSVAGWGSGAGRVLVSMRPLYESSRTDAKFDPIRTSTTFFVHGICGRRDDGDGPGTTRGLAGGLAGDGGDDAAHGGDPAVRALAGTARVLGGGDHHRVRLLHRRAARRAAGRRGPVG